MYASVSRVSSTTSSAFITIGSLSRKRAALAFTTTTSGWWRASASRTSSPKIVSPAM